MSVRAPLEDQAESHVCSAQVAVAICKALPAALSLLSSLEFATVVNNNNSNKVKWSHEEIMDSHIAKVTERDFWEMPELVEELVLLLSSVNWLKS